MSPYRIILVTILLICAYMAYVSFQTPTTSEGLNESANLIGTFAGIGVIVSVMKLAESFLPKK